MIERLERWLLFPRHLLGAPRARDLDSSFERITVDTTAGQVEGWFLPAPSTRDGARHPVVVFAHGNGEIIDEWPVVLHPYRSLGVSVFLPEYRGYGRSPGIPSEAAIRSDFEAFYDKVVARPDVDPARIVFHGRSLGGGVVCALSSRRPAAGLILESTFTSVADVARRWFVPPSLLTNRFESELAVRSFPHPILVFHGTRDRVIPYSHAVRLERAATRATLVSYDCDHNDLVRTPRGYWASIEGYLRSVNVI